MTPEHFESLLARLRHGDGDALHELLGYFQPAIFRVIRLHLTDPRVRRAYDSGDVWQSVAMRFYLRYTAGEYEFDDPAAVAAILGEMARNKVLSYARAEQADRRDCRRIQGDPDALRDAALDAPTLDPQRVVSMRELYQKLMGLLAPEERSVAERRAQGHSYRAIAAESGRTEDAVRKQLRRALDRVLPLLGYPEQ